MTSISENDVDDWTQAIANLHDHWTRDDAGARWAEEAVANLWSEFGYQDAPMHVLRMFVQAIETGYAAALRDVRDGEYDGELQIWRPSLQEG